MLETGKRFGQRSVKHCVVLLELLALVLPCEVEQGSVSLCEHEEGADGGVVRHATACKTRRKYETERRTTSSRFPKGVT